MQDRAASRSSILKAKMKKQISGRDFASESYSAKEQVIISIRCRASGCVTSSRYACLADTNNRNSQRDAVAPKYPTPFEPEIAQKKSVI